MALLLTAGAWQQSQANGVVLHIAVGGPALLEKCQNITGGKPSKVKNIIDKSRILIKENPKAKRNQFPWRHIEARMRKRMVRTLVKIPKRDALNLERSGHVPEDCCQQAGRVCRSVNHIGAKLPTLFEESVNP